MSGFPAYSRGGLMISNAHDDAMIDRATGAFIEALDDCRADGLL